jgi:hypothetical protein
VITGPAINFLSFIAAKRMAGDADGAKNEPQGDFKSEHGSPENFSYDKGSFSRKTSMPMTSP